MLFCFTGSEVQQGVVTKRKVLGCEIRLQNEIHSETRRNVHHTALPPTPSEYITKTTTHYSHSPSSASLSESESPMLPFRCDKAAARADARSPPPPLAATAPPATTPAAAPPATRAGVETPSGVAARVRGAGGEEDDGGPVDACCAIRVSTGSTV